MRVAFVDYKVSDGSVLQGSGSLRAGEPYHVLEVYCQSDGPNYFRLESFEGDLPALYDSRLFEVIDSGIPDWRVAHIEYEGSLTLGPAAWQDSGFWERVMDHSPDAMEIYNTEKSKITNS